MNNNSTVFIVDSEWWSQGKEWKQVKYNVQPGVFNFMFEAIKGVNFRSDYAIDDITFTEGNCPESGTSVLKLLGYTNDEV